MNLNSVGSLLVKIAVHYPSFRKQILNSEGNISKAVAEEWERRIGFLSDEEADRLLEAYLMDEEKSRYAPNCAYFLQYKRQALRSSYSAPEREQVRYEIIRGELYDQEGRIYADPNDPDAYWYKNAYGSVCKRDSNDREEIWQ